MPNILEFFFSIGDKVTKGNPKKLADWNYYMMFVIFIAFFTVLVSYATNFIQTQSIRSLGWAFVMIGILWFQYYGLKTLYEQRKLFNIPIQKPRENEKEMEELFNKNI